MMDDILGHEMESWRGVIFSSKVRIVFYLKESYHYKNTLGKTFMAHD